MTDTATNVPGDVDNAEASTGADNTAAQTKVDDKTQATAVEDWRAAFPEELRNHPSIQKFDSGPESLAKSYLNLERLLGGEKIAVPKSPEDAESWEKVFKALGRPDASDGYEFGEIADLPEGFAYSEDAEGAFRDAAHKAGLTQTQAQNLREWWIGRMAQDYSQQEMDATAAVEAGVGELRKEWGNATDQKINAAQAAVKALCGDEFAKMLDETGLGNNTALIRGFAQLAEKTAGDKSLLGDALTENTPGELDDQIASYRATHKAALGDRYHPEHDTRVAGLTALYQKRHPEAR